MAFGGWSGQGSLDLSGILLNVSAKMTNPRNWRVGLWNSHFSVLTKSWFWSNCCKTVMSWLTCSVWERGRSKCHQDKQGQIYSADLLKHHWPSFGKQVHLGSLQKFKHWSVKRWWISEFPVQVGKVIHYHTGQRQSRGPRQKVGQNTHKINQGKRCTAWEMNKILQSGLGRALKGEGRAIRNRGKSLRWWR